MAGDDDGVQGRQRGLLEGLKPGQAVAFEFVERQPGEYVVTVDHRSAPRTQRQPRRETGRPASGSGKASHSGH